MSDRAELLKLHDWDELLFGGFYCLHCTPDDEDSFDDPIAWPCQSLRDAGLTDDEAREIIVAHREKVEAEYRAKKAAEQAEAQRQVNEFNHRYPVGTVVFAYPGCRPEDGTGTRLVTRTRTEAQLSSSGYPVVWVEGEGAYICLTHVDPVSEDVWDAAREAEKPVEPEVAPESAARLSPERETEIRDYIATCTNWSLDAIAARDLLAELAAVRTERDQARAALRDATEQIARLEADFGEAVVTSEALNRALHDEKLAGSALYAALTTPTTPEQRQAALDQFKAVARCEEPVQ